MSTLAATLAPLRKAVVAAAGAGLFAAVAAVGAAFTDGRCTLAEAGVALGVGLSAAAVTGKAVFETKNADSK